MASLINPISLGILPSLLYKIPRTINMTPLLRNAKAISTTLPVRLFCAHTVSCAIILADRHMLHSAERKELGEIRAMSGEIREQFRGIGEFDGDE